MYLLVNYNSITFGVNIASFILSIVGFLVATTISILIFKKNRKNYIQKLKDKINNLSEYITKIQNYNRNLGTEKRWNNKNRFFSIFYTIEYLIMQDINSKIINSKGFIDWKQYNSINNIIKYNKKEIKNCNKILEKFRYLLEINKFTIDDFRIILFSDSEGVRFDLYGQFIDYNIIENDSNVEYVGLNRPYNIYKFLDLDDFTFDDFTYNSWADFNINKDLSFNLFHFAYQQDIKGGKYTEWNLESMIENVKKQNKQ